MTWDENCKIINQNETCRFSQPWRTLSRLCQNLQSDRHDPDFFCLSRFPDEELDAKGKRNLWIAETFSYFVQIQRESAEDLGLIANVNIVSRVKRPFTLSKRTQLTLERSTTALQSFTRIY